LKGARGESNPDWGRRKPSAHIERWPKRERARNEQPRAKTSGGGKNRKNKKGTRPVTNREKKTKNQEGEKADQRSLTPKRKKKDRVAPFTKERWKSTKTTM